MSVATVIESGPDRHALLASECECGGCPPTWARRRGKSRRFAEPVTLIQALRGEAADCRAGMVDDHRDCLVTMVALVDQVMAQAAGDDFGHPGVGLSLVMFAGELAAALRPTDFGVELPEQLVWVCEQAVTAAMVSAADCLAGLSDMIAAVGELAGY